MARYVFVLGMLLSVSLCFAAEFHWQKPQATVTETGAVRWKPEAFVDDLSGQDVRYIDYEEGDDTANGLTPRTAWKHHPWDHDVTGNAAECSGGKTYVFKRGVLYRGQLYNGGDSGTEEKPIRLTSTADWGEGRATLVGSRKLPAEWVKAAEVGHPERLAQPEKVWALDLTKMPWWNDGRPGYRNEGQYRHIRSHRLRIKPPFIGLFSIEDGKPTRNHLARHPNWQPAGSEFAHDYWPEWDGDAQPYQRYPQLGGWDEALKGYPQDYFTGAIFWSTYPGLMGGATPKRPLPERVKVRGREVNAYDPERGYFYIRNQSGFSKGTRYKIENLPQHLDTAREFYLDEESNVLFYRPPQGTTPNEMHLELVTNSGQLVIRDQSHIEISGLAFAYADGTSVRLFGSSTHVSIRHCLFHDLMEHAIGNLLKPDYQTWKGRYENHPHILDRWKAEWMDNIVIADNEFYDIWDSTISISDAKNWNNELSRRSTSWPWGRVGQVRILRNKLVNIGIRHQGQRYSSIPAIAMVRTETGVVAGNIVKRSFGAGIMVQGGQTGGMEGSDWPLSRILVYQNSTEDTAMAVNDYGGFSLWQSGVIYIYNNNIGNSTGHMPGGIFGNGNVTNLSYPYYIDGGYKIMGFNNIVWDRTADPADLYASRTAGYFSVFGFLNHFTNNTLYRHKRALGGSSGNRTDIVSNVFAEITGQFLKNNRVENPSLIGGGDTGATGVAGIPSLAYGRNIFEGPAVGGELVATNERKGWTVQQEIKADSLGKMAEQM